MAVTHDPAACPDCAGWVYANGHGNYHHVHEVKTLPGAKHTDSHRVRRGYAAGMAGPGIPQLWLFFDHIEPALVAGRAARMSIGDISEYGVYEAAAELRFDPRKPRDIRTLYVLDSDSLDRHTDEAAAFKRWAAGCDPKVSHFQPRVYDEGAVWEEAKAAYLASHRKPEDTDFPCRSCGAEVGTPCSWKKWRKSNSGGDVSHAPRWDKARKARDQYYLAAARAADAACDVARAKHYSGRTT